MKWEGVLGAGVQRCNPPHQGKRSETLGTGCRQMSQLLCRVGQPLIPSNQWGQGVLQVFHMPMDTPKAPITQDPGL